MKVTLIGAGPGDPGLLTLKGANEIKKADVVIYDRLVSDEILAMIPESCEKINVGKSANNHPVPQNQINQLLLEKAMEGLSVVRLKGGDPFLFGRGGEELDLLLNHNIPFEVIPGISSSMAAPTYAGIPITHRDYASSLHIVTGHRKNNGSLDINFDALVKLNGTIVFMMGLSTINEISSGCINAGMDKNMPAAIVENATTNIQRKFLGNLETLPKISKENNIVSPAVIIVGKVCKLSEGFDFFTKKLLLNKWIVVTRAKTMESNLSNKLKDLGLGVVEMPCIKIIPTIKNNVNLENALNNLTEFSWLVFTSGACVNLFFDHLIDVNFDIRKLYHLKIAAIGFNTKKEINKRGLMVDYMPNEYNSKAMTQGLIPLIKKEEHLLILRAKSGTKELTDELKNSGILYTNISTYETIYESSEKDKVIKMIKQNQIHYVTFTSSSTVEGFVSALPNIDLKMIKAVCIGERTANTAKSYGITTFISEKSTIESMVQKIKELCL